MDRYDLNNSMHLNIHKQLQLHKIYLSKKYRFYLKMFHYVTFERSRIYLFRNVKEMWLWCIYSDVTCLTNMTFNQDTMM